jgi:hypothetical protein
MTLRAVAPVETQPVTTLSEWAAIEVPTESEDQPWTRHLAGWSCETRRGRVSSPVVALDAESATCITASGRTYRLSGAPGLCPEGGRVLEEWLSAHRLQKLRDVSAEVFLAIQDAQDQNRVVH